MSKDRSINLRPDQPATIEWSGGSTLRVGRWAELTVILRNRWLVPIVASLGAVATFASFLGEWSILTIPELVSSRGTLVQRRGGVADVQTVGAFGACYLIGVLMLASAATIVLFGTPERRRDARLIGMTLAGGLLAILVAAHVNLHNLTEHMSVYGPGAETRIEYGRGLIMAYLGTAAIGLALVLAGRPGPVPVESPPADGPGADSHQPSSENTDWPWRRPRAARGPAPDGGHGPLDLTVGPTAPFAHPDHRD